MILSYYPHLNLPYPRKGPISFDKVLLKPGKNELSDAQMKALKAHPDYKKYLEMGAIAIEPEETPIEDYPDTLDALNVGEALDLIKQVDDQARLLAYEVGERQGKNRKMVLRYLHEKLEPTTEPEE